MLKLEGGQLGSKPDIEPDIDADQAGNEAVSACASGS